MSKYRIKTIKKNNNEYVAVFNTVTHKVVMAKENTIFNRLKMRDFIRNEG